MTLLLGSFATMLEAGVPLYRALHHLGENFSDAQASMLCQALVQDIGSGKPLSRAAARHPKSFTGMQIGLLRVGESAGCLDEVLKRLVGFEEKAQANQLKIRSALTYPAILLGVCLVGIALAPPLLLEPHFALIRDQKVEIPWPTACLMSFSGWMRTPIPYLALLGLAWGSVQFLLPYLGRREIQLSLTRRALLIPKLRDLVRGILTTGFDYPELEAVVMARPTRSLALWYQVVGRGIRPHPEKRDTMVIDLGGNLSQFGRVEDLELSDEGGWHIRSHGRQLTNVPFGAPMRGKTNH